MGFFTKPKVEPIKALEPMVNNIAKIAPVQQQATQIAEAEEYAENEEMPIYEEETPKMTAPEASTEEKMDEVDEDIPSENEETAEEQKEYSNEEQTPEMVLANAFREIELRLQKIESVLFRTL